MTPSAFLFLDILLIGLSILLGYIIGRASK